MTKTAPISIRVPPNLKQRLEKQAEQDGRSLASYVERVLDLHTVLPVWGFGECQASHSKKHGPRVSFTAADGWPTPMLPADQAVAFGERLIEIAKIAKRIPPG